MDPDCVFKAVLIEVLPKFLNLKKLQAFKAFGTKS